MLPHATRCTRTPHAAPAPGPQDVGHRERDRSESDLGLCAGLEVSDFDLLLQRTCNGAEVSVPARRQGQGSARALLLG